ncbi:MAG TPA: twin-arginine translocase TatA/TatE family subunit [Bacteroidia bacterium]|nr:twin-arginine translocase TatA/TatE family subunit [Bacteroidia bacterium]
MIHVPLIVLFLNLGSGEVFFIILIMLFFFGADKLPAMARALGKGMREMKNATAEIQREIEKSAGEVQEGMNLNDTLKDLREATDNLKNHLKEGVSNLENHYSNALKDDKKDAPPEEEKKTDDPISDDGSIKR